jgi:hypothetical protein
MRLNGNVVTICITFIVLCIVGGIVRIVVKGEIAPLIQLLTVVGPLSVPLFGGWWTSVKSREAGEKAVAHSSVAAENTNGRMASQFGTVRDEIVKLRKVMDNHLQNHSTESSVEKTVNALYEAVVGEKKVNNADQHDH